MNNMSKIRIINIKDNGYKTIRLISKRFKVKYYDPPVSDLSLIHISKPTRP